MTQPTIAIIGAGFSGTSLSLWLQASSPVGTRICLIEPASRFAVGRAYATPNRNHLLNVPAGRMSAFPDLPGDFVRWLQQQPKTELADVVASEAAFVPRALYGTYLRHLLDRGVCDAHSCRLELVQDNVIRAEDRADGVTLRLRSGAVLHVDIAVLATGNAPPQPVHPDIGVLDAAGLWRGNPWTPGAFATLDRDAPVLLIGTGLTMVDAVIGLLDAGHTGPIRALSRHGLLPRRHAAEPSAPMAVPARLPNELAPLVRAVRREISRVLEAGEDWRPVIDALRPSTQALWRGFSDRERSRFLRHLRAWWDVHRHRMPPLAARRIEDARASGQLHVHAGRIIALGVEDSRANVTFRQRTTGAVATVKAARVIDCTGPGTDVTQSTDPLTRALLRTGMGRADKLRLGLDVSATGALLSRSGLPSRRLFAVGSLTKGALWEITSVPDIRVQCRDMAQDLGKRLAEMVRGDGHDHSLTGHVSGEAALLRLVRGRTALADNPTLGVN